MSILVILGKIYGQKAHEFKSEIKMGAVQVFKSRQVGNEILRSDFHFSQLSFNFVHVHMHI